MPIRGRGVFRNRGSGGVLKKIKYRSGVGGGGGGVGEGPGFSALGGRWVGGPLTGIRSTPQGLVSLSATCQ